MKSLTAALFSLAIAHPAFATNQVASICPEGTKTVYACVPGNNPEPESFALFQQVDLCEAKSDGASEYLLAMKFLTDDGKTLIDSQKVAPEDIKMRMGGTDYSIHNTTEQNDLIATYTLTVATNYNPSVKIVNATVKGQFPSGLGVHARYECAKGQR